MDVAKYVLFLHVYSAVGLFVGMGLEYCRLMTVRRRSINEHTMLSSKRDAVFTMTSMLSTLFTGIYLMVARLGPPGMDDRCSYCVRTVNYCWFVLRKS